MIDLHIHTDASSDGEHSPREIFAMARERGLRALAFADHNSVDNVAEGMVLSKEWSIEFLPAIEVNTMHNNLDLHLLAYGIDPWDPALKDWLERIRQKKQEQAEKRWRKLNELGFIFSWDDLSQFSGGRMPTGMSFLRAILNRPENQADPRLRPYIDGERSNSPYVNFYRDFLRGGKPAFVHIEDITTIAAITTIKEMGGIPILAHPSDTGEQNIRQLIANGLEGLEVYSSYHNSQEEGEFRSLAETDHLLITAGSDFHGKNIKPDVELGGISGNDYRLFSILQERVKEKGWKTIRFRASFSTSTER